MSAPSDSPVSSASGTSSLPPRSTSGPSLPVPYHNFKSSREVSPHHSEIDADEFIDSASDSAASDMEFDEVINELQTTSLEEQKKKSVMRKESRIKEGDRDMAKSAVATPPQLPVEEQQEKDQIEYTKQQNELKYGMMYKITESKEEDRRVSKAKKTMSLGPIKFFSGGGHEEKELKEKDSKESLSKHGSSEVPDPAAPQAEGEEKIITELVKVTEKENRAKYKSMIPIKKPQEDVLSIVSIRITGYDKRFEPSKYYVYNVEIQRPNMVVTVFRRYSQFHALHVSLEKEFPNVKHPSFPPKILFGRSHIGQVSKARLNKLNEYIQGVLALKEHLAVSSLLQEFIRTTMEDVEQESFNKKLGLNFDDEE